jgi:glycosyltransferase involved in cell wall biosynthesis
MGSGLTVLIISNLYPPVVSGSSTQSSSLARELVKRGNNVIVVTAKLNDNQKSHEFIDNVQVYRIPSIGLPKMTITLNFPWIRWTLTPANIKTLRSIVKKHHPDIIHLHNHMFDLAITAVILKREFKIPLVITIHTIVQHPKKLYNAILYSIDRLFLRYSVINSANWIICPEKTIFQYVQKVFNKKESVIIPYGIEMLNAADNEAGKKFKAQYALEGKKIFLSLGHVHEIRDRKDIIEAMPEVIKYFPDFVLLIVGDIGTEKPRLLAKKMGIENSVIFTGPVPHSLVPSLFAISDMNGQWFQISNPQSKTLGIAALEAMSAGMVVIGTADDNVYGDNILVNGENVILIRPQDPKNLAKCIIDLLKDDTRRRYIGTNAAKTIENYFSWDRVCTSTVQIYERAISDTMGE